MKGHMALVTEHSVDFAVVLVERAAMTGPTSAKDDLIETFSLEFGVPAVLMSRDRRGQLDFYGRTDLSQWLANHVLFPDQLPWREFTSRAA
jgi:hypothetical protein